MDRKNNYFWLEKMIRNRAVQHVLFWVLSFYVLLRLFAYNLAISRIDFIYTFLFHLSLWAAVYVNLLILIPRLLRPRRYILYGLCFVLTALGGGAFNLLIFKELADWLFPGYYFIAYYDYWDILQFMAVYLTTSSLLKLSRGWFKLDVQKKKIDRLEKEKLEAEMRALKAQIDPHFLLNTLNNLYSLALDKDERTADLLLRLSQSMRYRLYECGEERILLEKEIKFIRNYLELQRLRLGRQPQIQWQINGQVENKKIAPLLFMPFIENAFKHGLRGGRPEAYLNIRLSILEKSLEFALENSKSLKRTGASETSNSGIGLNNIRRRLELLYPGKHRLDIEESDEKYGVLLLIEF